MPATMTRQAVAKRLGVSMATVRRLEGAQLHPAIGLDGVHRFDPAEVEAVAKTRPSKTQMVPSAASAPAAPPRPPSSPVTGEVAATVFADFDAGRTPGAVVVARQLPPDVVRRLHADWLDLRSLDVNVPSGARRLAALEQAVAGANTYSAKTVEALNALVARVMALPVPAMTEFVCDCGASGCVTVPLTCSACGLRVEFGTSPDSTW
jgi:hypothetical protein